jgi:DNA replication protein DnaC
MTTLAEWVTLEIDKHPFMNWDTPRAHELGAPTWKGQLRTAEDLRRTKICTTMDIDPMTKMQIKCRNYGRPYVAWDLIIWRDHPAHADKPESAGWSRCPECNARIEREQSRWQEQQGEKHNYAAQAQTKRMEEAAIPERYEDKTFGTWQSASEPQKKACEAAWHYADKFKAVARKLGRCMLMTGNMGTGKTHLACAVAHELLARGMTVCYTTAMEMLDRIRATYDPKNRTETKHAALSAYADVDLLIVDELAMSWGSESEKVELFSVFNARYNTKRPTLLACNASPEQVRDLLGERIYDRITEQGCDLIRFDWDSRRSA